MEEHDSQIFTAYQRQLARQLEDLEEMIKKDEIGEALKRLRDLIEDTRADIES